MDFKNEKYQNKNDKALDVKNSALSLLIVGVVGLIMVVLVFLNIIKLNLSLTGRFISCGTMGVLFLIFIIVGVFSFKSIKGIRISASKEDQLTNEITKWYKSELTAKVIDDGLFDNDDTIKEEEKYFERSERILELINNKFMNMDADYAEHMMEIIYNDIFA